MGESVERPYHLSVGEQIWERALRNHYTKPFRDEIARSKSLGHVSKRDPEIFKLLIHDVIQQATIYLHQKDGEKITVSAIADLLTTPSFSISENVVRKYLGKEFRHLKKEYGISAGTLREIGQRYKSSIIKLWGIHGRKPTLAEITRELDLKGSSGVLSVIMKSPWLNKLWEDGPKQETTSENEG